jgi:sugar phosphate isomerase/epimerase
MRLGGPVADNLPPDEWIAALRQAGYRAAICPVDATADTTARHAYVNAAYQADILLAEVDAWSNPISPDDTVRHSAVEYCQRQLALADEIGACCCVNIAGSRGSQWDGPHPANLTPATFDLIVETVRKIIDAVNPKRTFYTLEPMPWVFPDSVESYVALIKAIDRPRFGVHLDPVNLITSPRLYFNTTALLEHCFHELGPHIKSCHAKDITFAGQLTVQLLETCPGQGALDYRTYLRLLDKLGDIPLMLEHLPLEQYAQAGAFIRVTAREIGIVL